MNNNFLNTNRVLYAVVYEANFFQILINYRHFMFEIYSVRDT